MDKDGINTNNSNVGAFLIIILIIIGIFWFFIRPAMVRSQCGEWALMVAQNYDSPRYNPVYEGCLHEKGLQ